MSEDSNVLHHQQHGGLIQLEDRVDGSEEPAEEGADGPQGAWALLRSTLADSSLPQIGLALGVVVAVVIIALLNRGEVLRGVQALTHSDKRWLALATVISLLLLVAGTITQFGSMSIKPPVRRVFAVQVAASFANHLLPAGTGGMAVNVRFLHRHGLGRGAAVGSVGLNSLAGLVTHVLLLVTALALSPAMMGNVRDQLDVTNWYSSITHVPAALWIGVLGGLAALAIIGLVIYRASRKSPAGRWLRDRARRLLTLAKRVLTEIRGLGAVIRQPSRATALWAGSFCVPIIHGLVLYTVLHSIGAPISMYSVLLTYVFVSSLTALVPSPGGVGALDVVLPTVFSLVGGISFTDAVTAVVGYRLLTVWLPLLPGAATFTFLLRRRII